MTQHNPNRPVLDLTKYAFKKEAGEITLFGTWYGPESKPVLVLVPTLLFGRHIITPCVVPLINAWLWSREHGDPVYVARESYNIARKLGLTENNMYTCMKITTLIQDHIDALKNMPLKQSERAVVADAFHTDEYGKVRHVEVIENV